LVPHAEEDHRIRAFENRVLRVRKMQKTVKDRLSLFLFVTKY
jgi:hypothetical protein